MRTFAAVVGAAGLLLAAAAETSAADPPRLVFSQWTEQRLRYDAPRSYLCSADATGGSHFRVTDHPTARDGSAAYRPQGDRVAFLRTAAGEHGVWTARADGTDASRFLEPAEPVWSADGSRLLVILDDTHVWSVGWPGGDRVRITRTAEPRLGLAASPDGTRLAFVQARPGVPAELVVLRLDDLQETVVHSAPLVSEPSWSPDSATIAFTAAFDVWTVPAAGGVARRVAVEASAPAFAPAGDTIAFVRNQDIWTMRADGAEQRNVTRSPVPEREPAWQPGSSPGPAGRLPCAIVGTEGDDVLVGTEGADFIYGLGGNDRITALGGDDIVRDGAGNDTVDTGGGNDDVHAEAGHNTFLLGAGADELFFTTGGPGSQTVDGGTGNDRIQGGTGRDRLSGGEGRDVIFGLKGADVVRGGPGNDDLYGDRGDDSLEGGAGNDRLWGGFATRPSEPPFDYDGYDLLTGGSGNDALAGGWQKDRLFGGPGNDRLSGGAHADYLVGEAGVDFLLGDSGDDLLLARDGHRETVSGGPGFDRARLDPSDRRLGVERAIR